MNLSSNSNIGVVTGGRSAVSALIGKLNNVKLSVGVPQNSSKHTIDYCIAREGYITNEDVIFGYVKLITIGNGADSSCFQDQDLELFKLTSAIPNLILYTDGNEWALYRSGQRVSDIVKLSGDIKKDGKKVVTESDAQSLGSLLYDFFLFEPIVPTDHQGKIVI